jgi:hypothetical protein
MQTSGAMRREKAKLYPRHGKRSDNPSLQTKEGRMASSLTHTSQ